MQKGDLQTIGDEAGKPVEDGARGHWWHLCGAVSGTAFTWCAHLKIVNEELLFVKEI